MEKELNQMGTKIALYGGAFDPVHSAHLAIAKAAKNKAHLDAVIFLPAAQSPLKAHGPHVSDNDRLAMLRLALGGESDFAVDDHELNRGGPSYTVDTVRHFKEVLSDSELFWIIGADQYELLPRWRCIDELVEMVTFLVFARPGSSLEPNGLDGLNYIEISAPLMTESSSEIRARCAQGRSIAGLVPESLEAFISQRGLYTSAS